MALQSSGAISLANVQTEFGGSNPISISEYYGAATGVPGSGIISLSDFYGTSAVPAETESQFIHTNFPGVLVLSGTLGNPNCDFYMYNNQRVAGSDIVSWGLNSVGDGYPQWAGQTTGPSLIQNSSFWVMIELGGNIDPNTWDWFHLYYPGGIAVDEYWRYYNTTWASAGNGLWYLVDGTLWSYEGYNTDDDFSNVSGPYPSLARHLANFWNGDPNFIDNAATITLANGP